MNIEELRKYCLSLGDVTEKMPFPHFNAGKDILAFYVNGHIFCFFDIEKLDVITVRANPQDIDEIKAKYHAVGKPYNFSPNDWIGIYPSEGISDEGIKYLIDNSYSIVKGGRDKMRTIWNPWHGCVKCSEGCANCYMYYLDRKRGLDGSVIRYNKSGFRYPVQKTRQGEYKVPSGETLVTCLTSDFFLAEADQWREEAWEVIRKRPDVNFWIITKRPQRVMDCLPVDWGDGWKNVSLSVTCENQRCADLRIPILLDLPFVRKNLSVEPLIGPMDIERYLETGKIRAIHCGGENYDGARPCDYLWVKSLSEQCRRTGVRFDFFDTGMKFIKDGKLYNIKSPELRHSQAIKSGLSFFP